MGLRFKRYSCQSKKGVPKDVVILIWASKRKIELLDGRDTSKEALNREFPHGQTANAVSVLKHQE
jgi:hypothetical protein